MGLYRVAFSSTGCSVRGGVGGWEGASPSTSPDLEIPQILSSLTSFSPLNGDLFPFHLLKERICFHVEHTSIFYCWEREEK